MVQKITPKQYQDWYCDVCKTRGGAQYRNFGFRTACNQCGCAPTPGARREKIVNDTAASNGKIGPAPSPHPKGAEAMEMAKAELAAAMTTAPSSYRRPCRKPSSALLGWKMMPSTERNDSRMALVKRTTTPTTTWGRRLRLHKPLVMRWLSWTAVQEWQSVGLKMPFRRSYPLRKQSWPRCETKGRRRNPSQRGSTLPLREVAKKKKAVEQAEAKVEQQVNEIKVLEQQLAQAKEKLDSAKEVCKLAENEHKEAKEKLAKAGDC